MASSMQSLKGRFLSCASLLTNIVFAQIVIKSILVQVTNWQQDFVVEQHTRLAYFLYVTKVDDLGAVDSHEIVGKALLQPFE